MYYDRGDLPIKMEYLTGGEKISWLADINKLDYSLYLPLFFDGLSETKHPYKTYARQGVRDLLNSGGDKIHAVIPQLIIPIKSRCSATRTYCRITMTQYAPQQYWESYFICSVFTLPTIYL